MSKLKPVKAFVPKAERLVSAAIRRDGTVTAVGRAHWEVRKAMGDRLPNLRKGGDDEGFMTDAGRFVLRAEAKQIAVKSGQLPPNWAAVSREVLGSDINWGPGVMTLMPTIPESPGLELSRIVADHGTANVICALSSLLKDRHREARLDISERSAMAKAAVGLDGAAQALRDGGIW